MATLGAMMNDGSGWREIAAVGTQLAMSTQRLAAGQEPHARSPERRETETRGTIHAETHQYVCCGSRAQRSGPGASGLHRRDWHEDRDKDLHSGGYDNREA